ncbi:AP2 domain-containing protein [Candidatus Accumulibacter sp. ACC007]|uniref:AP2 domain-containing protein n=1 Tax=Candidatus Accumulibacter sp. ACC007 TaxID=2823333 RepID=UPI0025BBB289|nr:AP2 domain-containing protein [Candidatus Accumulibacter sp. ACC007]
MYAISRHERRPGIWYWAVMFTRQGKRYYQSFYDFSRGGPENALAAAIAWRDEQLAKISVLTKRAFCQIKRTSNRTGVPGVHFIRPKNQPQGSWAARIKLPDGRQRTKAFAVKKYGENRAFSLAVEARSQLLELVEDTPFLHDQVAKKFAS